jgi:hypothetical protein
MMLTVKDEKTSQLLEFKDNVELIELALIRGLSIDRSANRPLSDYIKYTDDE